jgi:hypothetical protein
MCNAEKLLGNICCLNVWLNKHGKEGRQRKKKSRIAELKMEGEQK